ncbi:MAG: hypothetical protein GX297_05200 [Treponema sp.]|nr:hypothetical protein [Treponema sp.]
MKRNMLCCFMISIFISLFADTTLLFNVGEFSNKSFPATQKCEIKTDELGRIIYIKNEKENWYSSVLYDKFAHFTVNFADDRVLEIDMGNFDIHIDTDSFRINRTVGKTDFKYEFKKNILICSNATKNEIEEYYICRDSGENYELSKCYFFCTLRDLGYDSDIPYFIDTDFNYLYSKKAIAKLKSKDKSINLLNAKVLITEGIYSLVPFLLLDSNVVSVPDFYNASSELKEKNAFYKAENLRTVEGLPWASANGYGIGDKIFIRTPTLYSIKLAIYNGFQSDSKKYLYKANSRAKKIRIKSLESEKSIEILLKDIPNEQYIDLSSLDIAYNVFTNLEITILEVYPGDKYKDLCIQAIIPVY